MRIAIDISQIAYEGTGVAVYTKRLIENLFKLDKENEYLLFYSSLRKRWQDTLFSFNYDGYSNVKLRTFFIPQTLLDLFWNHLHIFPIEWFVGEVDVFISSDWTQPPTIKAKKVTVVHDLSPLKHPEEHHALILAVHKRRLKWVKKECDIIICDSESTKNDVKDLLKIEEERLRVIYPGGRV